MKPKSVGVQIDRGAERLSGDLMLNTLAITSVSDYQKLMDKLTINYNKIFYFHYGNSMVYSVMKSMGLI